MAQQGSTGQAVTLDTPPGAGRARLRPPGGSRLLWGLLISLGLALISGAVWPTIPSYDPFSWVVWGREVSDPHISFLINGGPSWKPLPFLFTTIYGFFGGAAPWLWVVTARAGGIFGLLGAARLAWLLCEREDLPVAGWAAGAVAAAAVLLTTDWTYYFFRGTSEPLLIGMALWSVERLVIRRHGQAWLLGVCLGLMRPEAWPFLLLYGAWLWWRVPRLRLWVVLGLVAQPAGWFVPPWISTGEPFLAATHASDYNGHLGSSPAVTALRRGATLQPLPALIVGALAVLLALPRLRSARAAPRAPAGLWARLAQAAELRGALPVWLGAGALAWWVIVVAMTLDGYPGLQRFFLPAAALTCVLAGYGVVRLAVLAGHLAGRAAPSSALVVGLLVGLVLLAASAAPLGSRVSFARAQEPLAALAVRRIDELGRAVRILGGRRGVLPCPSSVVTVNHSLQTALAWKLGTTLERVQTVLRIPGLAFVGPHGSVDGGAPPISHRLTVHRLIRRVGAWRIYEVYAPGPKPPCVGG